MFLRMIYDEKLAQAAYVIGCPGSGEAIVFDPLRDVDRYVDVAKQQGVRITKVAETHVHADFLSGARELAEQTGAEVLVSGEGGAEWTPSWLGKKSGGGAYDHRLLSDGDTFSVGSIEFRVVHTPGHTPEHVVYVVKDTASGAGEPVGVVSGDFLFVGDVGRPDLLETAAGQEGVMRPAAEALHGSLSRIERLPDFAQVWPGHGAGSACGKSLGGLPSSTVGYEKRFSPALALIEDRSAFVSFILDGQPEPPAYFARMKRDNVAGPPVLGGLPKPERVSIVTLRVLDASGSVIIDTRPWASFRDRHVASSLWIPIHQSFTTNAGALIDPGDDVYLIADEAAIDQAVRDLVRVGIDRVRGWCPPDDLDQGLNDSDASIDEVSPAEARTLTEADGAYLLDVRRASEVAAGGLPGAGNIAHTRLAVRVDDVPTDQTVYVSCQSGRRSAVAASYLRRNGRRAVNVAGGFAAWASAGLPIESHTG